MGKMGNLLLHKAEFNGWSKKENKRSKLRLC